MNRVRRRSRTACLSTARGLTFIELMIVAAILGIVSLLFLSVLINQVVLSDHTRNLSWAALDASRVMEQLREQNSSGCVTPSAAAPAGFLTWDAWLAAATGGGGKSIQPDPAVNELVTVSNPNPGGDPVQVTVAICWRHRNRVVGECQWTGVQLLPFDADADGVITSPAMLSARITCRAS